MQQFKCAICKWYKNNQILNELYPDEELRVNCGIGNEYYCVINNYSLYEMKGVKQIGEYNSENL